VEVGGCGGVGGGGGRDGEVGLCGVAVLVGYRDGGGGGLMGKRAYLGGAAADPVVACGPVGGCPGAEVVISGWMRVKRGWDGVEGFGVYLLPPNRKS